MNIILFTTTQIINISITKITNNWESREVEFFLRITINNLVKKYFKKIYILFVVLGGISMVLNLYILYYTHIYIY